MKTKVFSNDSLGFEQVVGWFVNTIKDEPPSVGLVPKQCESGQWKGRMVLSKNGSGRLRAKRYLAAVVASRHNQDVRQQFKRLVNA